MKRAALAALGMLLLAATGCAEVREGWDIGAAAAANLHRQDTQALCKSFDPEMLTALPCDAVEEVMARTTAVVAEPTGECRWGYTYRIVALEPMISGWIIKSEVPELEHPKALIRLRTPRVLAPG